MTRSVRRWLPVLAAASLLAPVLAATGQGVASADDDVQTVVEMDPAGMAAALPAGLPAGPHRTPPAQSQDATCHAGQDWEVRFEICRSISLVAVVTQRNSNTGAIVTIGESFFLATHHFVMNRNSRTLADNLTLTFTSGWGDIAGLTVTLLGAGCGANCPGAVSWVPGQPATPGSVDSGTVVFTSLGLDTVIQQGLYQIVAPKPNAIPVPGIWSGPSFRCDSAISTVGGCVNPRFIPTMISMLQLPNIAANIRVVQNNGPNHWGKQGFGRPLNRTTDQARRDRNHQVACASRVPPSPTVSCDEYPFESTTQGAASSAFPDWNWSWVPVNEQNSQAGYVSSFYQDNRVLDGDAFWVSV